MWKFNVAINPVHLPYSFSSEYLQLSDLCIRSPLLFDLPDKQTATVCIYFEIQSVEQFEYDDIHVKYTIHMPAACKLIDDAGQLNGSTHSSQRNAINGQWLIGHCHELVFSCSLDCLLNGKVRIASVQHRI